MSSTVSELFEKHTFLSNAGTETYLVFQQGFDLPEFCAFHIHEDQSAWNELEEKQLFPTLDTAAKSGYGLLLDVLVWRAQPDFLAKLNRDQSELDMINKRAVDMTRSTLDRWRKRSGITKDTFPVLIAADLGPKGDGYKVEGDGMTPGAASDYHQPQIDSLVSAGIDVLTALTMTSVEESIGIMNAAKAHTLPIIISPTVETNGFLPDDTPLGQFIEKVDQATDSAPLFYMVNCAHPEHLLPSLDEAHEKNETWLSRFKGFRANASTKSHEELDNNTDLDRGDVDQLASLLAGMKSKYGLKVIGGCCGTDHDHIAAIASAASVGD